VVFELGCEPKAGERYSPIDARDFNVVKLLRDIIPLFVLCPLSIGIFNPYLVGLQMTNER
jgi:hypothetical protein